MLGFFFIPQGVHLPLGLSTVKALLIWLVFPLLLVLFPLRTAHLYVSWALGPGSIVFHLQEPCQMQGPLAFVDAGVRVIWLFAPEKIWAVQGRRCLAV